MRHLKPNSSFRSKYAYDNLLYIIAGEVVGQISGISFEDFLEQRLLFPLGMRDCSASLERTRRKAVKATPHVLVDGKLEITDSLESSLAAAAGGINCSARSMATWMSFILNKGLSDAGEQIISAAQVDELLKPVTLTAPRGYMKEHAGSFLSAYALGWGVSTFYGQPMYSHGGGLWGMTTYLALLPEQKLAIFVSNNQRSPAPLAVVNDLFDQFLTGISSESGQDWITLISEISGGRKTDAAEAVAEAESARAADSKPSLPLEAYAGTYRDPWYGNIQIKMGEDGRLWFHSARSEPLSGPLEHFQYDTFIARWSDRKLDADAYVSFYLTPEGDVERIRMKAVSPATDFSFDFHDLDLQYVE
jgi:CubicO group peptidase (beta-lactamase class C family)